MKILTERWEIYKKGEIVVVYERKTLNLPVIVFDYKTSKIYDYSNLGKEETNILKYETMREIEEILKWKEYF